MTPSRASWALLRPLGLAAAVLFAAGGAWGQTTWTKYPGNPVLPLGAPGQWDGGTASMPVVLFDGATYRMWYAGGRGVNEEDIGYATSPDGVTWTKHPSNPVLRRDLGAWDAYLMWPIAVVFHGGTYHLWYSAFAAPLQQVERTGYATSPDGVTWTKYSGNPILPGGPPGSWDDAGATLGGVLVEDGTFRGWYAGARVVGSGYGALLVGYAASSDGVNWTKWPEPVIEPSQSGWDLSIDPGPVVFDGSAYHMWYTGFGPTVAIGHAVSADGIHWTKQPAADPVLQPSGSGAFDIKGVALPSVVIVGDTAQMWYAGSPWQVKPFRVGYATAPLPFPDPAVADFKWSPASPRVGQTVNFTDWSTNTPTSWAWAFGDGATSTDRNPTHAFAAAGTYTVTLTATNASGPSNLVMHDITVVQPHMVRRKLRPAASWSANPRGSCLSSFVGPGQGRPSS